MALILALLLSQLRVLDEGVAKGMASQVNCTGTGVTCTVNPTGVIWTLDVSGGGSGAPTDATYITMNAHTGLSAEVVVPTCAGTDALTSNGTTITCMTPSGSGAPTTAQYWTGAADAGLSAEKNLGALGTGLVLNTAGTPSIYAGATCGAGTYASATSASGALTCSAPTGSPGGSTTQVQFNDAGAFGGDAGFVFNKTTKTVTSGAANGADAVVLSNAGARMRFSAGGISDYLYSDGAYRILMPGVFKPGQIESNSGTSTFLFHGLYAATAFVTPVWQFDNSYFGSGTLFSVLDGPSGNASTKVAYEVSTSRTGTGPIQHTFGVTNSTAAIQANAIITQGSTAGTAKLTLDEVFSGRLEGRNGTINYAPLIGTSSTSALSTSLVAQFYRSGDSNVPVCAIYADGHTSCTSTGGGGADALGSYLVQTATNAPANAQIMASLGTGLVLNTTTTGVQSIKAANTCTNQFARSDTASGVWTCAGLGVADFTANQGTTTQVLHGNAAGQPSWGAVDLSADTAATALPGTKGGTGLTTTTAGGVLYGAATNTTAFTAAGTAGQGLVSAGAGAPAWARYGEILMLAADKNGNGTTPVALTELSKSLTSGATYGIRCVIYLTNLSTTNGARVAVTSPAVTAATYTVVTQATSATVGLVTNATAASTWPAACTTSCIAQRYAWTLDAMVNPSATGTWSLAAVASAAGSTLIASKGSWCEFRPL